MIKINIRRFAIGLILTWYSMIFIYTNCYLGIKQSYENSNECPRILDVSLTEMFHQLKNVPKYYYALLAIGFFWIVISILSQTKETIYEGTHIYISNQNTAEYKYGWIIPWFFPGILYTVGYISIAFGETWKMSDIWILAGCFAVMYFVSIAITFPALRNYTISEAGIIIHYPLRVSITYSWKDFDDMTFDHESQGSEYNLIIWNSRREYFDKYSPQNVIILYPGEDLRYILHFAPEELKKDLLPLPEKIVEINEIKRKRDIIIIIFIALLFGIGMILITGVIVFIL